MRAAGSLRRLVFCWVCASGLGCFYAALDQDELAAKAAGESAAVSPLGAGASEAGDAGSDYTVSLDTPPIELDFDGDEATRDPCVATTQQARAILEDNCADCHAPPAAMGGFRSILDFPALLGTTSNTLRDPVSGAPARLVIPGDPDGSRLYRRAAAGEMPPARDASLPQLPRPTISDVSVLREWIESCLPEAPEAAPPPDAGMR